MELETKIPYSKKVHVGKSKIHGLGILAKKDLKKGETAFIIKGKRITWEVKDEKGALYGEHWIGIAKNTWIDPRGYGRYLNHSSKPTCGIRGEVTVCALRDIKEGDEVCIDYAITEDQPLWWMHDFSQKGKKGIVRSVQFLTKEKFEKYLPFVPRYFQKVYRQHHSIV
ncbi:MAG: hypothetical protein RLY66_202 [Candidatus Parcubacteria bacterium]|jgi:SET domain-containing protein